MATRRAALQLVRRPGLWPTAVGTARRLASPGWWRRSPHLPVPDERYLAFRMETAYGDPGHPAEASDLVEYLEWCRRRRRSGRYL